MIKVLIIEDRKKRQEEFIARTGIDLNESIYNNILDNMVDGRYLDLFKKLKSDIFDFDDYSVIISHKSAFENENAEILSKLETYCQNNNKVLVLFSGGIDTNYYFQSDAYEHIELNSKTLYSENMKLFLEDCQNGNLNPLILCYGSKWKLNILLNVLEKLTKFILSMNKERVLYNVFLRDNPDISKLDSLNLNIYSPIIESRKITKDEILKLKESILDYSKMSTELMLR